jgi:hypothetical protein
MIGIWRPVLSAVLGVLIALSSGSDTQAQACGGGFAKFVVVDAKEVEVPDVTIELVAELPREEYAKYKLRKGHVEYGGFSFKLSASEAEELVARGVPSRKDTDFCGNPLKQRANYTRVKTHEEVVERRDGSVKYFGFCTLETYSRIYLLKISAPGYITDYYVGTYLGGCGGSYSFILTKSPETTNSTSHKSGGIERGKIETRRKVLFSNRLLLNLGHGVSSQSP